MNAEVFQYVFPGIMVMWICFIAQNAMADIYIEQNQKTLFRLQATTASLSQVLMAKMFFCFTIAFIAEILLITFTYFVFGMTWGNPFYLFIVLSATNLSITGLIILIYGVSKTQERSGGLSVIVILFSCMLGGGMMPYEELPKFLQSIGQYSFVRYSILAMQHVIQSHAWKEFFTPVLNLFTFGAITLLIGLHMFKRRLEKGA